MRAITVPLDTPRTSSTVGGYVAQGPERPGIPINWWDLYDEFGKMVSLNITRCGYCKKKLDEEAMKSSIMHPINNMRICGKCQQDEMELAEIDTREDDLKSQWMEEKYGYLRDEQ